MNKTKSNLITPEQYLMGRDKIAPLSIAQMSNMNRLLASINALLTEYGQSVTVSSGYRPPQINQSVGGAKQSAHQTCEAIDLVDQDGHLCNFILNNIHLLQKHNLFLENPMFTRGWVHLQTRPTKSGNRIFLP